MKQSFAGINVLGMFRLLGFIVFVAGIFGAGFYSGVRYYEHEIVQNPNEFLRLYKREFTNTAKEKIDELKKQLLDKSD